MKGPLVSIVIVNYNSGTFLRRCLEEVSNQSYANWEIIIVDNASTDNSIDRLPQIEQLRLLRNTSNEGFARAQNRGLRLAHGQYLMPLNFDLRMTGDFLFEMVSALERDARIGSVCGKLLRMTPIWESTDEIDSTGLVMSRGFAPSSRGHGQKDTGQFDQLSTVLGSLGAAPLYRREMLLDIAYCQQYFDEKFFMWYEDVDLDWRAYLRGWRCCFVPSAVAYHVGHEHAQKPAHFYVSTTLRNRWMMVFTNATLLDLRHNLFALVAEEVRVFRYTMRSKLAFAYIKAIAQVLGQLRYLCAKRMWVQSRARRHSLERV